MQSSAYLRGVYNFVWRNLLHTNPPLCVTEEQLRAVMAIVNDALTIADGASGNV
jgi:adenosylmethionine-8-amino-7-oxononanoate aminotransferase